MRNCLSRLSREREREREWEIKSESYQNQYLQIKIIKTANNNSSWPKVTPHLPQLISSLLSKQSILESHRSCRLMHWPLLHRKPCIQGSRSAKEGTSENSDNIISLRHWNKMLLAGWWLVKHHIQHMICVNINLCVNIPPQPSSSKPPRHSWM